MGFIFKLFVLALLNKNGIVEIKHQHHWGVALLFQYLFPSFFWTHALSHIIFSTNRLPSKNLYYNSHFFIMYNKLPNYSTSKIYGCLVYATTSKQGRTKFYYKSRKCLFLGHKNGVRCDILFSLLDKKLFLSRDIIFIENIFPYPDSSLTSHITLVSTNLYPKITYMNTFTTQHIPIFLLPHPNLPPPLTFTYPHTLPI